MKVLKNNYEPHKEEIVKEIESYPRKFTCEYCGSELEYDKEDLRIGGLGLVYLDCPLCNYDNMIDGHEDTVILTKDNAEFPTHFNHTSKENGAVDCCNNKEVREYINKAIEYFRKNKNEDTWMAETGNLHIDVYKENEDKDYYVVVANNYYGTYIDFEHEDY